MGKSIPAPPPPPDPRVVSAAQTQSNVETAVANALLNNISQYTPYGSIVYNPAGSATVGGQQIPLFSAVQTLSPEVQALVNQQFATTGNLNNLSNLAISTASNTLGQPIDLSALPSLSQNYGADATRMSQAAFDRQRALLDPVFADQQNTLDVSLANRGIPLGSEIYNNSYDTFNRSRNQAYNDAAYQSVLAGYDLQSQLFGQDMAQRQNAFKELSYLQNLPISQIATLMGSNPGVPQPDFNPFMPSNVSPTDVTGAYLGSAKLAQDAWAQQAAMNSSILGGLFGLGGALGAAGITKWSSESLKDNITDAPSALDTLKKLTFKEWSYKGDLQRHFGPMAEHWKEVTGLGDGKTISLFDMLALIGAALKEIDNKYSGQ